MSQNSSTDWYVQHFTQDRVPFYVNSRTGVSSWVLPEGVAIQAVKFITHHTSEGVPYYENIQTGETTWTLPVSAQAEQATKRIASMTRRQSESFMKVKFNEALSQLQEESLDAYRDELAGEEESDDEETEEDESEEESEETEDDETEEGSEEPSEGSEESSEKPVSKPQLTSPTPKVTAAPASTVTPKPAGTALLRCAISGIFTDS